MATIAPGWLSRTDLPGQWLVRAPLFHFRQHFVPAIGKSARCQSPNFCVLCAHDLGVQSVSVLLASKGESHVVHLIRLLEKDRISINWLERQGTKLVGQLLELSLLGYVDVAPISRRVIPPIVVDNYLAALGRKAYCAAIEALAAVEEPTRGEVMSAEQIELQIHERRKKA